MSWKVELRQTRMKVPPPPSRHAATTAAISRPQLWAIFDGICHPAQKQISSSLWRIRPTRIIRPYNGILPYKTRASDLRRFQTSSLSRSTSSFSYRISASYSAKGHRFDPDINVFNFNPYTRIQPTSINVGEGLGRKHRPASGEDAFFISRVGETGDVAVGIVSRTFRGNANRWRI
jgi:hypothetical protein